MKTRIALFALTLAALPLAAQSASAHGFWGRDEAPIARDDARIWHDRADIARDRRELARDRSERDHYAFREREAARHGDFGAARYFDWRRHREQAEINAERRDIARDRHHLAYERFHRNHDEWRYR
jgi:hypothetical protein